MNFNHHTIEFEDIHPHVHTDREGNVLYSVDVHGKRTEFEWTEIDSKKTLMALTTCSGRTKRRVAGNMWNSFTQSAVLSPAAWYGEIVVHNDGSYTLLPDYKIERCNFHSITFHIDGTVTKKLADGSQIVTYGAFGEILGRTDPTGFPQRYEWDHALGNLRLKRVIYGDGTVLQKVAETHWVHIKSGRSTALNAVVEINKEGYVRMRRCASWQFESDCSADSHNSNSNSDYDNSNFDFGSLNSDFANVGLQPAAAASLFR